MHRRHASAYPPLACHDLLLLQWRGTCAVDRNQGPSHPPKHNPSPTPHNDAQAAEKAVAKAAVEMAAAEKATAEKVQP